MSSTTTYVHHTPQNVFVPLLYNLFCFTLNSIFFEGEKYGLFSFIIIMIPKLFTLYQAVFQSAHFLFLLTNTQFNPVKLIFFLC